MLRSIRPPVLWVIGNWRGVGDSQSVHKICLPTVFMLDYYFWIFKGHEIGTDTCL